MLNRTSHNSATKVMERPPLRRREKPRCGKPRSREGREDGREENAGIFYRGGVPWLPCRAVRKWFLAGKKEFNRQGAKTPRRSRGIFQGVILKSGNWPWRDCTPPPKEFVLPWRLGALAVQLLPLAARARASGAPPR
jgi:hypothetical protein